MTAPRSAEQRKNDTLTRLASDVDAWIATADLSANSSKVPTLFPHGTAALTGPPGDRSKSGFVSRRRTVVGLGDQRACLITCPLAGIQDRHPGLPRVGGVRQDRVLGHDRREREAPVRRDLPLRVVVEERVAPGNFWRTVGLARGENVNAGQPRDELDDLVLGHASPSCHDYPGVPGGS
jgi:hypothetical protein